MTITPEMTTAERTAVPGAPGSGPLVGPRPTVAPPLDDLLALADRSASAYASADPFPHAVIDGLFDVDVLRQVVAEIPSRERPGWTTWDTTNEWKYVFDQPEHFGPGARLLADTMASSEFLRFLERLTGVAGLQADPHYTAAGYFQIERGGFLDVHLDFARNPKTQLVRRVNALVYLNDDWDAAWGGQLELWRSLEGPKVAEVVPLMNRMVVFSTPDAAHGHPQPVTAPPGRSRLCFSAFYYSSPDLADAPTTRHGVLFSEQSYQAKASATLVKRLLPPILADGVRAARRAARRRAVERS